jgi:hypothetical protein
MSQRLEGEQNVTQVRTTALRIRGAPSKRGKRKKAGIK